MLGPGSALVNSDPSICVSLSGTRWRRPRRSLQVSSERARDYFFTAIIFVSLILGTTREALESDPPFLVDCRRAGGPFGFLGVGWQSEVRL